ncbi:MAG TPA: glycosyltransferase family 39 protein [Candidatus Bathyarchaeia archaeon]|nr:glycosyltransferase family 39 protein [Candidatus Bathyarchaeia archaeon]
MVSALYIVARDLASDGSRTLRTSSQVPLERALLGTVLLAALVVRLWGAGFGLPELYHPDEHEIVDRAAAMLRRHDPNPHWFSYPTLYFYVQAAVAALVGGIARHLSPALDARSLRGSIYLAGRVTTALFGTATVAFTALAARRLWGPIAGLGAALVIALSFDHVENSQFITTDVPSGLFVALCLWCGSRGAAGDGERWFLAAGAAAGLAAATKYNAGMCVLVPLLLWGVARERPRDLAAFTPIAIVLAAGTAFLFAMPWFVLDARAVARFLLHELTLYREPQALGQIYVGNDNWSYYVDYLWSSGLTPTLFLLIAFGWIALAVRERRTWLALSVFPILYYAMLASLPLRFTRNLMPIEPSLAMFGGFGVALLAGQARSLAWPPAARGALIGGGLLLLAGWPAARLVLYDRYLARPDTRQVAAEWIERTFPPGTRFCIDLSSPRISGARYRVVGTRWPNLHPRGTKRCDVLIVSSPVYGPLLENAESHPDWASFYREVFSSWPLLAEFRYSRHAWITEHLGDELGITNPVIRVYRVPD